MVVSPQHPKMIIFSRKTHGCWVPPFKETPIQLEEGCSLSKPGYKDGKNCWFWVGDLDSCDSLMKGIATNRGYSLESQNPPINHLVTNFSPPQKKQQIPTQHTTWRKAVPFPNFSSPPKKTNPNPVILSLWAFRLFQENMTSNGILCRLKVRFNKYLPTNHINSKNNNTTNNKKMKNHQHTYTSTPGGCSNPLETYHDPP